MIHNKNLINICFSICFSSDDWSRITERLSKQAFRLAAYGIVLACAGLSLFSAGCTEERDANHTIDFQLNLNLPEVMEKEVSVNGGVVVPVDRIQWDWGDGQMDKHHFFPAQHLYNEPGQYRITVTAFDIRGRTAVKAVFVEIK